MATVLWRDAEPAYEPCSEEPDEPYSISHCFAPPSAFVLIANVTPPLLGLAAIAALAATALPSRKIVAGLSASALVALLGLTVFRAPVAEALGVPWMRAESAETIVGPAAFLFGALVSWASLKWWPSKSLGRPREG
jgi:hypothetical protein